MPQRPNLANSMKRVPISKTATDPYEYYAATRAGMKKMTVVINPEAWAQFRKIVFEEGITQEAMLLEAINDLFDKYHQPRIA